jgi:hypothetical protein
MWYNGHFKYKYKKLTHAESLKLYNLYFVVFHSYQKSKLAQNELKVSNMYAFCWHYFNKETTHCAAPCFPSKPSLSAQVVGWHREGTQIRQLSWSFFVLDPLLCIWNQFWIEWQARPFRAVRATLSHSPVDREQEQGIPVFNKTKPPASRTHWSCTHLVSLGCRS